MGAQELEILIAQLVMPQQSQLMELPINVSLNAEITLLTFMPIALFADSVMQLVQLVMVETHTDAILVLIVIWSMRRVLKNHQSIAFRYVLMDFMIMVLGLVVVIF